MGAGKTTTLVGGGSSYIVEYVEQGCTACNPKDTMMRNSPKAPNGQGKCGNTEFGPARKKPPDQTLASVGFAPRLYPRPDHPVAGEAVNSRSESPQPGTRTDHQRSAEGCG